MNARPEPARPRVAMIVANDITRDSRVQKAAYSTAQAGYEVLLLGYDAALPPVPTTATHIGAAKVVRTGLGNRYKIAATRLRAEPPTRAREVRLASLRARSLAVTYDYKARRRIVKSIKEPGTAGPGAKNQAKELLWKAYFRDGDWRRTARHLLLLEEAWYPVLAEFAPDVIHAHDMHTPGIAVRVADRIAKSTGRRPKVLYDAHEYVAGVAMPTQRKLAYEGLEAEFVHDADAIVTVSPQLAKLLQDRYHLTETPGVVANAPMLHVPGETRDDKTPNLREVCGLGENEPLVVYSGALSKMRGVETMIEAMPELPEVHTAIVCGERNAFTASLEARAAELGVADRLHFAPYVAPHQVAAYLSSADAGAIPILHTPNHEIALITKYYEYMHARLPIVVSDVEAMADATRRLGNGEVFTAGDAAGYAQTLRKVLDGHATYAGRYTEELLARNSWEGQANVLTAVYAELTGSVPEPLTGALPLAEG